MVPLIAAPVAAGRPRRLFALVASVAVLALVASGLGSPAPHAAPAPQVAVVVSGDPGDPGAVRRAVEALGGTVTAPLPIVDGFSAEVPASAVDALAGLPGVRAVTPNRPVHVQGAYGEGSGGASAVYADAVRASKTWSEGFTGAGIGVALIDTGVNADGDLAGKVVHAEDFTAEQDNRDSFGHGTFLAGLIAGSGAGSNGAVKGVAPDAHLVSVKIAGRSGETDLTRLLAALQWVVTFRDVYGIRVLNLSIGTTSTQDYRADPLNFAVERVWNAGIVVVASAGNGSGPGTITKPGDDPLVVTVGASDDRTTANTNDDGTATFSSAGPTASNGLAKPDLLAPGKSVVSSRAAGSTIEASNPGSLIGDRYQRASGTSFSAAIASGAAALVLSRTPQLTPNQVKHRLVQGAKALQGGDPAVMGAGVLDAWRATASDSLTSANAGVAPALGGGSLQASRGTGCLRSEDGACLSDEAADAAVGFDSTEFFGSQWAGSHWAGSQWAGSQWAGSQWAGSQWAGSQWAGSQWAGSQWAGSQWAGSQWAGSQWAGSQWAGSQWAGSQWAGSQWAGSQWAGSQWAGSQWAGSQWAGSQWAGAAWD